LTLKIDSAVSTEAIVTKWNMWQWWQHITVSDLHETVQQLTQWL